MNNTIGVAQAKSLGNGIQVLKDKEAGFMVLSGKDGEKILMFDLNFVGATITKGVLIMPMRPEQLKSIQIVLDAACHTSKLVEP